MANSSGTDRIDLIHKLGKDFREREPPVLPGHS